MIKRACVKVANALAFLLPRDHKKFRCKQNRRERAKSTSRVGTWRTVTAVPTESDSKRTHSRLRWCGKSRDSFVNRHSALRQVTSDSRMISHPTVTAHTPIVVGGRPIVERSRHKSIHVLDPTHHFDGTMARESIRGQNQAEMILPMFVLAKRTGAALVRNIDRDIQTLRRLEGLTVLSTKHEGMKWWNKQMGAPYECVVPEVWIAALSMATNDLQMRGFIVHKFEIHADVEVLRILWSLDVRGDVR